MKKKIYFVQVSAVYGETVKTAYLPYASGCLAAYAFENIEIAREYELGRFIFLRENIDQAIDSMDNPFFVGFSSYIWNMEYNREFAKRLRKKYPDVIIAFGGHNIKPDGSDLEEIPEADILMHGEGEEVFKSLLLYYSKGGSLREINNLSFRENGQTVTTEIAVPKTLADFPSPYTKGFFDGILKNSNISPSVIWETNRGCPNRCAFCDWGALKAKVRMFPMEKIKAELDWFVKNKIEYIYCADANFGLFPRDIEIADMIIQSKKTFGYPQAFRTNYTKNNDDVVFDISKKLIKNGAGKSPTLSFQSLSPKVLENIGRSNMELDRFKKLMTRYNDAGVPTFSELILGLPGETYDSFASGIDSLLQANQHTALGIYPCELLPNSQMGNKEYAVKFGIQTVKTAFAQYHTAPEKSSEEISELSNIVIGTLDMPPEDWKRSFIFSVCIQAFHNLALTRAIAIYLYKEKNLSYKDFYEGLIRTASSMGENTLCGSVFSAVSTATDRITRGLAPFSIVYGEKEHLSWSLEEYMFLRLAKEKDRFYDEAQGYFGSFGIEPEIFRDLMAYQREIIKQPGQNSLELTLDYDFYGYFQGIYRDEYSPLKKTANTITVSDNAAENWDKFARYNVWYGRRDDAQLYTGKKNKVEQSFCEKKKKNIYMIQATNLNGDTAFLPYAVGVLIAFAKQDKKIEENYNFADIFFLREDPDKLVAKLENPFYVGFSTYMWNYEYNKVLSKKIKEAYPNCLIQFGGHQVSPGEGTLEDCPWVDFAIHNEGEEPFKALLSELTHDSPDFSKVPNLSYRKDREIINNPCEIPEGSDYPSPYLEGIFDKILSENPHLKFDVLIETSRGCPNKCTYCGWGMYKSKLRLFPMERIRREIQWASDRKIEFFGAADANFGMLPRDEEIMDWIVESHNKTGYPKKFQVSYAKNSPKRIFSMTKKLNDANMDKGVTLSFQSLDDTVLKNIGRENISLDYFTELLKLYAKAGIPTYSELIMGLPGETYESFIKGVDILLNSGQHSSLFIHILEWLPCSAMGNPEYMARYGVEYSVVPLNQPHREKSSRDTIPEFSRIVTKTASMSNADWIKMNMFSTCVQAFHHLGLMRLFAIYCRENNGIAYSDFYNRLLSFFREHPNTVGGRVFAKIEAQLTAAIEGFGETVFFDEKYGDVSYTAEEFAFLETVYRKKDFYREIQDFVAALNMDTDIARELFKYQMAAVRSMGDDTAELSLSYDFPLYFKNVLQGKNALPKKCPVKLKIAPEQAYSDPKDYARFVVWYGRRSGKTVLFDCITPVDEA